MLDFSPAKINLGLNVIEKRHDGFHNIETVFYPIQWRDALEVLKSPQSESISLKMSGLKVEGDFKQNIIYKAYEMMANEYSLPSISVFLNKTIPMGAGLGGGSSNASTFINLIDKALQLNIPLSKKLSYAKQLGSDCAFFIDPKPAFATQKGDVFESISINLDSYYVAVAYPNCHSNTTIAYDGVIPKIPQLSIKTILETKPIEEWKTLLVNDFENSVFKTFPQIKHLKESFYNSGAIYASMSGSGSAVFGIFKVKPFLNLPKEYLVFVQEPNRTK